MWFSETSVRGRESNRYPTRVVVLGVAVYSKKDLSRVAVGL